MTRKTKSVLQAACIAAATLASTALIITLATPVAVHAKGNEGKGGGNGGGNGKGADRDRGGDRGSRSDRGNGARSERPAKPVREVRPAKPSAPGQAGKSSTVTEAAPLHPSEKGKWNAANANQAALDAHIRNQNFNGTIGALAQYQLAARAAAGEELTEAELAALDGFIPDPDPVQIDTELAALLNEGATEGDPIYSVESGVVSCVANCDGIDLEAVQAIADAEAARLAEDSQQAALDEFLTASEARIVEESNKSLSPERAEDLLDELAGALGVSRAGADAEDDVTSAAATE
ncbi:hypothetical protein LV82_01605 [Albidovulum inexpectatum]|uniref:Uncharacterized protein n=1 Tax=Albidovulum inexpectatum TaxID=196587 RepID=A0A2S5JHD8_9RHOB|nr:hypothetical protein [Albidovulum inexpectatum]PPB80872.1 hypothetical protein LV82_01605 [Albidovulum inexpectatum]